MIALKKVLILGAGTFGIAMGTVLNKNGHDVVLWEYDKKVCDELKDKRINENLKTDYSIPKSIEITSDLEEAFNEKEIIILAVPSRVIESVLKKSKDFIKQEHIILNLSKGLSNGNFISRKINEITENENVVVLSGPNQAEEIIQEKYTEAIVASKKHQDLLSIKAIIENDNFKIRTSSDIIGVELAAALKNIYAILIGYIEEKKEGVNYKSIVITECLNEMIDLGCLLGAKKETFLTVAGIGDFLATSLSEYGRNKKAGNFLAKGYSIKKIKKEIGMVVEGFDALKSLESLLKANDIKVPENIGKLKKIM